MNGRRVCFKVRLWDDLGEWDGSRETLETKCCSEECKSAVFSSDEGIDDEEMVLRESDGLREIGEVSGSKDEETLEFDMLCISGKYLGEEEIHDVSLIIVLIGSTSDIQVMRDTS